MDFEWCRNCDRGLPAPDCVIFLDIPVDDAAKVTLSYRFAPFNLSIERKLWRGTIREAGISICRATKVSHFARERSEQQYQHAMVCH